jgi:hypothetical protein
MVIYMKRCSISVIGKCKSNPQENQLISITMAFIKNKENYMPYSGYGETGTLVHY